MRRSPESGDTADVEAIRPGSSMLDVLVVLARSWKLLVVLPLLAGVIAAGITYIIHPTYTGRTTFIPPQGPQGAGAAALASLGTLANLTGATAVRTPADQYAALAQSETIRNKLIERFKLVDVYDVPLRHDARRVLAENTRISIGRRDGLITIEVDDHAAARSAELANAYVEELKLLASTLALTEAQQRRSFFESEVKSTRERLVRAQEELQRSGFSGQALRAEPKAAAETYARLQAQVTAADVRLQALRRNLTDSAPEVASQISLVEALRRELAQVANNTAGRNASDEAYVARYREFRYQETLFDLLSRQYELARLDERRDGATLQVIDAAVAPERRSSPKRGLITVMTVIVTGCLLVLAIVSVASVRASSGDEELQRKLGQLRGAFRLRA